MYLNVSKIVRKPNYDFCSIPLSFKVSSSLWPSKQLDEATPVMNRFTNYCVQCPCYPIKGLVLMSISYHIFSIVLVIMILYIKIATPWFDLPIKYVLFCQTPSNNCVKVFASMESNLRLLRSTFVPENDFGGSAKIIFDPVLTLNSISAIAATKQFYLIVSLLIYYKVGCAK